MGDETALECCVAQFHGQIAGDDDGLGTLNSILRDQYDDDLLLFSRWNTLTVYLTGLNILYAYSQTGI